MKQYFQTILIAAVISLFPLTNESPIFSQERIHNFVSEIDVLEDGRIRVVETITVTARGHKIKRGIYRDFPTLYRTKFLVRLQLPFDVVSVKRNGNDEPYHTENQSNGVRLYIGHPDRHITPGEHSYKIVYFTNFQIGYFENHDELYWNAVGHGWDFPIDQATVITNLPSGAATEDVWVNGFTGLQNATEKNLKWTIEPDPVNAKKLRVVFSSLRGFKPNEGLTVVVGWPKGLVAEPPPTEYWDLYKRAFHSLVLICSLVAVVLSYFLVAWIMVGRDPPGGVVYPRFEPPEKLSPAASRYIWRMGYDRKSFAAALINLGVWGCLRVVDQGDEFVLEKTGAGKHDQLSSGEKAISKVLFSNKTKITVENSNHKNFAKAITRLQDELKSELAGKYFRRNGLWLVPGIALSVTAVLVVAIYSGWADLKIVLGTGLWLSVWSIGAFALSLIAIGAWKSAFSVRKSSAAKIISFGAAIGSTLFASPFVVVELIALGMLAYHTTWLLVPMVVALVFINWLFWHLIKQPTVEGQRIRDEIEGFRMYLGTAEQERLDQLHPPEKTPELFEAYLPYALALNLENKWAEKFESTLKSLKTEGEGSGHYRPMWYSGNHFDPSSPGMFSSGLAGALGGAIASAAVAPGSSGGGGSSGFSGGGFSGGGGGGGGGGGW